MNIEKTKKKEGVWGRGEGQSPLLWLVSPKIEMIKNSIGWLIFLFLIACSVSFAQDLSEDKTVLIAGKVTWEGHNLSKVTVQVYKDDKLKDLYGGSILLNDKGDYELRVGPGSYYLVAFVDEDEDGQFDIGDGMGVYGITDWNDSKQVKKVVTVQLGDGLKGIDIPITSMMVEIGGHNRIVAVEDALGEVKGALDKLDFKQELEKIATGISGRLILPDSLKNEDAPSIIVFAYTDLTWKYRVGQANMDKDGNFTLNVPPGRYYLLAIADENQSNLFDAGDEFGIFGMDDLHKARPKTIFVESGQFVEDVKITIAGKQNAEGKIVSLKDGKEIVTIHQAETVQLSGKIIWWDKRLTEGIVSIYSDTTLTKPLKSVKFDEKGNFSCSLQPGDYYVVANVDADGDKKYSNGDGIGGYGTTDITAKPPAQLSVKSGKNQEIKIFISAQFSDNGQLTPIFDPIVYPEIPPFEGSGISGKIIWEGQKFAQLILLISNTPEFEEDGKPSDRKTGRNDESQEPPASESEGLVDEEEQPFVTVAPLKLKADGKYAYPLPPGDYYVMAVVDIDKDMEAGLRDGVGIYGTRTPMTGSPKLVTIFPDRITPFIDIEIRAIYIDEYGSIAQIEDANRANIRQQHGEPENIYTFTRFGVEVEEWWYWTKGIAFTFEKNGPGWRLKNTEEFKPQPKEQTSKFAPNSAQIEDVEEPEYTKPIPKNSLLDAVVYYTYDNVIWGLAPDGTRQPISLGEYPTVARDGVLSLVDIDGNVRIVDGDNPAGRIALKRDEMAFDPVISPDGKYLAFVRKMGERSQLFIKHLKSGEELPLTSVAEEYYTPAWSADGYMLAYAANGSVENPSTDRNIYGFDQIENRITPIVTSPADEAEPVWSPIDPNMLVFSREEGKHRQIWLVTLDKDGKPTERQLTKFGGQQPAWCPDGSGLVYESNGQIWTVDVNGTVERPILIAGKPVFGYTPFAQ